MTPIERYRAAHQAWFKQQYPLAYSSGHYCNPKLPIVKKANGLTMFCLNYITWSGGYANRINTMGRLIDAPEKQPSGVVLTGKKWMNSTTKKGTADLHCIIQGRHVSIEIKIGADRMSDNQRREQERITAAGGVYIVVKDPDGFLEWWDSFVSL